ncbi:TolC family protein [Pseudohongiella sp. O18]|uniref:TolC family protein n=1 Tax=Pseudohongiella sp. O18 TaxID=2904248 RepID=UPI001F024072|nr:TolC family protein [Pseudohongiella sp. O18]
MIKEDLPNVFVQQEPITGALTLEEALARALKYNLDHRLMLMEEVLRNNQLHLSRFDMLPTLALNSGYVTRSNENLNLSRDTGTGNVTTDPSLSQDRNLGTANLNMSWNVLDFGVSYYQAHQNADQYLIAQERRRRVVNQVVQQVRAAYWRAATAEPLYRQVEPLLVEARQALVDAREVESQRLTPPLESLQYQKGLVEVIRELEGMEMDLAIAKAELASLMGLRPGEPFSLALPATDEMQAPQLDMAIEDMEELALLRRPELIEERYQQRISAAETRKALLRLFPSLTLSTSANYDSNSYLVNQNWADAAARLSWNLLNLASGPSAMRAAEAAEDVAEMRRLSLSMAALTQVHVSYQQYLRASKSFDRARVLDDIESRIFLAVSQAADNSAQSPLQRIRARMAAIYAEVNSFRAYAEVHSAVANLYVSMGLDLLPETVESHEITDLAADIREVLAQWNDGDIEALL